MSLRSEQRPAGPCCSAHAEYLLDPTPQKRSTFPQETVFHTSQLRWGPREAKLPSQRILIHCKSCSKAEELCWKGRSLDSLNTMRQMKIQLTSDPSPPVSYNSFHCH
uniref:Uncharacterized protein n=1 Tax=Terrapene triunguis TaxID=2587831 RepID=A0A674IBX8_9SAUR